MKKFIEIVGINNIGKTTQIKELENFFTKKGHRVATIKFPVYDLEPTGPRINAFLREGNPEKLSPLDFQKLNVQNRTDFEKTLKEQITDNDLIIAEMYIGSAIAFGVGDGVSLEIMNNINKDLLKPDVTILLDGDRFMEAKEKGHYFEEYSEKSKKIRQIHLDLAKELNWPIVNANQSVEEVLKDIISCL